MNNIKLDLLEVFDPRLDWMSVLGNISHIDRESELPTLIKFFNSIGFHKMENRKRPTFRCNIHGIEVSFGRKRKSGQNYVKIEFQGQFFAQSMEQAEPIIKSFVKLIWETFGVMTPPKVTRLDYATDIKNISHKELFPDFADERYYFVTNSKNKPKLTHAKHYDNEDDPTDETGVSVDNSRFEFAIYERLLKLNKYAKISHKDWYVDYYKKLYGDADRVLRIEVRVKKELCEYFNIAFFVDDMPLQEVVKKSMAHFNHHHRIYDSEKECFLEHIDKLFYREEYQSIKALKLANNVEDDLEKLHFTNIATDINPALTQIARTQVANEATGIHSLIEIMMNLQNKINKEVDNVRMNVINQQKTEKVFNFKKEEQKKRAENFSKFSQKLNQLEIDYSPQEIYDYFQIHKHIQDIGIDNPFIEEENNYG